MFANVPMTVAILLLAVAPFGMKAVLARKARKHTQKRTHNLNLFPFLRPFLTEFLQKNLWIMLRSCDYNEMPLYVSHPPHAISVVTRWAYLSHSLTLTSRIKIFLSASSHWSFLQKFFSFGDEHCNSVIILGYPLWFLDADCLNIEDLCILSHIYTRTNTSIRSHTHTQTKE